MKYRPKYKDKTKTAETMIELARRVTAKTKLPPPEIREGILKWATGRGKKT